MKQIAEARAADASGVVIAAPAGTGKSRLARDAVAAAEADGAWTGWVQATRSAAVVPLAALSGLLPEDGRFEDTAALMGRSAASLRERSGGRPVVLGVDDAQLLDPTSAALILHLSVARIAFVVATVRRGEAYPDAVGALWKDAGAMRLELAPLSELETIALVEGVLGAPVEKAAHRWLFERSGGNVLYLRELLVGALDEGALRNQDGFWRLTRPPTPSLSLVELIGSRLDALSPRERRALALVALADSLQLGEMLDIAGPDALATLETRGLARVEQLADDAPVRLEHPLYGEVILASLPVVHARQLRLDLLDVLTLRGAASPGEALRLARLLRSVEKPVPPDVAVSAAGAALLAGDGELAAGLAQSAVDDGAGPRATLLLARAHALRSRFGEAEALLAVLDPAQLGLDAALDYLDFRTMVLFWGLRRPADALALLNDADGWWDDATWRRRLDPLRLYVHWLADDAQTTSAETGQILADPQLEPSVRRRIEIVHATTMFYEGHAKEACALALRVRPPIPLREPNDELAFDICCLIAGEAGEDLAELTRWITQCLERAVRTGDDAAAGIGALNLGELSLSAGRHDDAARYLAEAVAHLERRDPFGYLALAHGWLAVATHVRDASPADAMRRFHEALGERQVIDVELPYVARIKAWEQLVTGDPPAAQNILLDAAARCAAMPFYAIQLRYEAMRAGVPARKLSAGVRELRGSCDARLANAYADHVLARADKDGLELLRIAEELAAIGVDRYAAECAAHAAEAFAAQGREDSARRAATLSRELHARGQGGDPPHITGLDADDLELTPRERQLIDLVRQGMSNPEIADRLVLSRRTVESHMYRAMRKLGVSDRHDLVPRDARP